MWLWVHQVPVTTAQLYVRVMDHSFELRTRSNEVCPSAVRISHHSSPAPAGLAVASQGEDHVVLTYANLVLLFWRDAYTPASCARIYDLAVALSSKHGGKVSVISILRHATAAPSPEARQALGRMRSDPQNVVHRSAVVFPDDGFVGAIIRSVVLSLRPPSQRRQQHETFQNLEKALWWATDGLSSRTTIPVRALALALRDFGFERPQAVGHVAGL